jgi:uncharacterized membrane protein YuzA (DUF378 family)
MFSSDINKRPVLGLIGIKGFDTLADLRFKLLGFTSLDFVCQRFGAFTANLVVRIAYRRI